ncbi:MAG: ABC transporter substrate-binding protein [Tepidisphaeraceae bacterium]
MGLHGLLKLLVVILGCMLIMWGLGWTLSPGSVNKQATVAKGPSVVSVELATLYKQGLGSTMYRDTATVAQHEAPLLHDLVDQGKLPPLAERVPEHPVVMEGEDGIGNYGGTWMRLALSPDDVSFIGSRLSGTTLFHWSPMGYPLKPHVAEAVESSADKKIWTVTLRRGLKWSDGVPYTADDILYWWNGEALNKSVGSGNPPAWMTTDGLPGTIKKIDAYHVRFSFPKPYPLFVETFATNGMELCNTPEHYLRQYNPDPAIGNAEVIAREQRGFSLPSPNALYSYIKGWQNPDHPRLWPWIYRTYRSTTPQVFVRNPYYFAVDPKGNQLPYIDRLQMDVIDPKLVAITSANGGVSMQDRGIQFSDFTEIMSRRQQAGTRVLDWYSAIRSVWVLNPNLNRRVDPNAPATRWKAQLLADKHFRQALSIAIDREEIIRGEYVGVGEPAQVSPGPGSPFDNPKLAKAFTHYDPDKADAMLDAMGLTHRDSEGMRTFPDGTRMTFFVDYTGFTGPGPVQFVVDDWARVGVRAVSRERARPLFGAEKEALDFDFHVWTSESDAVPLLQPRELIANDAEAYYAVGWGRWFQAGGMFDSPQSKRPGQIPVPKDSPMYEAMRCYTQALRAADLATQKKLMSRVTDIAAENLWTISISTPPPALVVVGQGLRNVPKHATSAYLYLTPANTGIETYYFEKPSLSPGAMQDAQASIIKAVPRPGSAAQRATVTPFQRMTGYAIWIACILLLIVLAWRYPFIGRRLLIMVPTLAVISIVIFSIIRLPPGDFLTTRITQLEENSDPTADRQIADLKNLFHYEDSPVTLYLRWTGLRWFATFNPSDLGLLQGELGRSMETLQPISTMIGDRITLTVLISLGTILFTWALALPVGIYSAVRQYSLGDYVLTLVGFIGMCVPAFLLALVLMAVSGMSGLFSPQFASQPEWNLPKVVDLLKHVWVPVVVLGIGGTAGMIRVMRANLLDELRKPYVVTARAKGVRPTKLLVKYPVRLALNPFVSSIGGLFPALVSGNAIVSIVLALPTVGPLMLTALFNQDTYLAGSMLMVLSILSVAGTLVSDLLLLWLDPRIRFEGGGR